MRFANDQEVVNEDHNDAHCNEWQENCRLYSRSKQIQIKVFIKLHTDLLLDNQG